MSTAMDYRPAPRHDRAESCRARSRDADRHARGYLIAYLTGVAMTLVTALAFMLLTGGC